MADRITKSPFDEIAEEIEKDLIEKVRALPPNSDTETMNCVRAALVLAARAGWNYAKDR